MEYRTHDDMKLSEIGIGCYSLSGVYGEKNAEEFGKMVKRAVRLGINFFDTADIYGDAEKILGAALEENRNEVHIATKVGVTEGAETDLSGGHIRAACEKSLKNLRTDRIDLYQIHFDDPKIPVEEIVETLEDLKKEGKILKYGVGHLPVRRAEEYFEKGDVFSSIMELSAAARNTRTSLLPLCEKHGVGAIAFSTTGRGLLTGKIGEKTEFSEGDIRRLDPLFQRELFRSSLRISGKLTEIGRRHSKTTAQTAIAWVLSQPAVVCALAGPSTAEHLEEDAAAGAFLTPEDLAETEAFFAAEDEILRVEQKNTVKKILEEEIPEDTGKFFVDLVYAMETSITLDPEVEDGIIPIFKKLMEMKGCICDTSKSDLEKIRSSLKELLASDGGPDDL